MSVDKSPIAWAITPLKRYAEFSGRSSRAEFWWFMLAILVCWVVIWFLLAGSLMSSMAVSEGEAPSVGALGAIGGGVIFMGIFWLALLIPTIAVGVRRLHDTDRSGWWLGAFYLLYAIYTVMLFSSMSAAMGAAMSGGTEPPVADGGMVAGVGILALVMLVYSIVLLVFYCLPGTKGDNRFGPDPYGEDVEKVFA